MGTRAVIQIVGCAEMPAEKKGEYTSAVRLYRHSDGNPQSCLPAIAAAITMMDRLVDKSLLWEREKVRHIAVESMAYAIVANSMSNRGLTAVIEQIEMDSPSLQQLGDQSDLEWLYVVDCEQRLVNVYSSKQGYPDGGKKLYTATPTEHLEAGFFSQAEAVFREEYIPEAQEIVLKEFAEGVQAVAATGWHYNEIADPYLAYVQKEQASYVAQSGASFAGLNQVVSAFCI